MPRGLEPTPECFLDETVERPHVLEREHASMGQGIHPLQVADSFGQKPSDDLVPLDFGTGLHLAMQFRGYGQRDIGHGLDYVRAHSQTFGEMEAGGLARLSGSGLRAAKTLYRTSRVRSLLNEDEGLPYEERPPRSLGYSATWLSWASALLLATNLIWLLAVALNLLGPLGPLTAGLLAWVALTLDLPGAVLLGAAYGRLRRETGDRRSLLRMAIFWGFVGWASLSVYWRFLIPLVTGTDVLDLFQGLLGASPGALILARNAWPSMQEIFAVWIAAAALFFVLHVLIALDYRRASEREWSLGVPAYAWLLGTGFSLVSTILIVVALLPVLAGGLLGPTFTAGALGKLLVTPNIMLSGYTASMQLSRVAMRGRSGRA